jgi:hypothetical protein
MRATSRDVQSEPTKKCSLAALLALVVMLLAGTHALAADTIEELLQQDEVSGQNDVLRPDLKALTEVQWEYYFVVGHKLTDTELDSQLVAHEGEKPTRVRYIWLAVIAAGFGMTIGAIKAWPSVRRSARTLIVPVQMEGLGFTIATYTGQDDRQP